MCVCLYVRKVQIYLNDRVKRFTEYMIVNLPIIISVLHFEARLPLLFRRTFDKPNSSRTFSIVQTLIHST